MARPRLLDLFCGAGGCSVGYHRAGFDVVGVDHEPHPDYPFLFMEEDAMDVLADTDFLGRFDVVHASPPCPRYSAASVVHGNALDHPDLVPPTRQALRAWGGPYVIENVPGAPLDHPLLICGWAMGYRHLRRHRLFESPLPLMSPGCLCPHGDSVSVFGHSGDDRRKATIAARTGTPDRNGRIRTRAHLPIAQVKELMGVEWMTNRADVADAIPPGYTHYLGEQVIDLLGP